MHLADDSSGLPASTDSNRLVCLLTNNWWEKSDWPSLSEPGHMHHRPLLSQCIGLFLVSCSLIQSVVAHAVRVTWEVRTTSCRPVDRAGFLEKEQEYLVKSAWELTMILLAALLIEHYGQGLNHREPGKTWTLVVPPPLFPNAACIKVVAQWSCIFPSVLWLLREGRGNMQGRSFGLREMADPVEKRLSTFLWPRAPRPGFPLSFGKSGGFFWRTAHCSRSCAGSSPGTLSSLENWTRAAC